MKKRFLFFYADWDLHPYAKNDQFCNECKAHGVKFKLIDVETPIGVDLSIKYGIKNVPAMAVINEKTGKVLGIEKGNAAYQHIVEYI